MGTIPVTGKSKTQKITATKEGLIAALETTVLSTSQKMYYEFFKYNWQKDLVTGGRMDAGEMDLSESEYLDLCESLQNLKKCQLQGTQEINKASDTDNFGAVAELIGEIDEDNIPLRQDFIDALAS